ncbi:MAG: hypothetical protein ACP5VE_05115 [Chthonomonadales bacterium]
MQRFYVYAVHVASTLLVACSMLLINYAFEAAGSVPDLPMCGFMAGNIWALMGLYPAAACALTCYGTVPALRRRRVPEAVVLRCAWTAAATGSFVYFAGAAFLLGLQGRLEAAPAMAWLISAFCIPITALGGIAGVLLAREGRAPQDLQGQEG